MLANSDNGCPPTQYLVFFARPSVKLAETNEYFMYLWTPGSSSAEGQEKRLGD